MVPRLYPHRREPLRLPARHRPAQRGSRRGSHPRHPDGEELDMGTPMNANPEDSDGACYTHAPNITPAARENRRVLGEALSAAGLVNYPTEWWHWSYGDRYWALATGAPTALYGPRE
ncbi:M15 family metallopeptidase [Streptomyces sp. LBUM 1476]|nr:M15 family metallopeptidase [Streptomyces sp. LBUM 1476]